MPEPRPADDLERDAPAQPAVPVWAPNPGVPIVARVLAYAFGAMLLLTVAATCLTPQAPDVPPIPRQWSSYTAIPAYTLPYPQGWYTRQRTFRDGDFLVTTLYVSLMNVPVERIPREENAQVRMEVEWVEVTNPRLQVTAQGVNAGIEEMLRKQLAEFKVIGDDWTEAGTGKMFTFVIPPSRQKMTGEWLVIPRDRFFFCLYAFAPAEGWSAMHVIMRRAASNITFASK